MKRCPFCAEEIQDAAIVCKHCGRDLNATRPATPPAAEASPAAGPTRRLWFLAVLIGFWMSFFGGGPLGPGGVGFFLMWIGVGLGSTGTGIMRWGGGFVVTLLLMLPSVIWSTPGLSSGQPTVSLDLEKARQLVSQSENAGMITRWTCIGNEAHVKYFFWTSLDAQGKKGLILSLAALCEEQKSGARITILDSQSGKRLGGFSGGRVSLE